MVDANFMMSHSW